MVTQRVNLSTTLPCKVAVKSLGSRNFILSPTIVDDTISQSDDTIIGALQIYRGIIFLQIYRGTVSCMINNLLIAYDMFVV